MQRCTEEFNSGVKWLSATRAMNFQHVACSRALLINWPRVNRPLLCVCTYLLRAGVAQSV
jgi:hypothetical protein